MTKLMATLPSSRSFAVRIVTPRLLLRRFQAEDAPALAAVHAQDREHLERWLGAIPTTTEAALATIAEFTEHARLGRLVSYAVFLDGLLVGSVQLGVAEPGRSTLGYWIARDLRRRGLATEAASAVAHVAFATGLCASLAVTCDVDNGASVAVASHLGFRFGEAENGVVAGALDAGALVATRPLDAVDAYGRRLLVDDGATVEQRWRALRGALHASYAGSIPVTVDLVDAVSEPAVRFSARVAAENAISPQTLLRHNATLAVGAVALVDGQYVLLHIAPLASLSVAWAIRAVKLLDHEARRLARGLAPDIDPRMFSSFAE